MAGLFINFIIEVTRKWAQMFIDMLTVTFANNVIIYLFKVTVLNRITIMLP